MQWESLGVCAQFGKQPWQCADSLREGRGGGLALLHPLHFKCGLSSTKCWIGAPISEWCWAVTGPVGTTAGSVTLIWCHSFC